MKTLAQNTASSAIFLSLLLAVGLRPMLAADTTTPAEVLAVNLSQGQVEIELRAAPSEVGLDSELIVVLTVSAPATLKIELPDLRDRFQGFSIAEGFPRDPITLPDGRRSREYRWRLVPSAGREYRMAPFAVTVRDTAVVPPEERSFATRAVVFPAAARDTTVAGDVELDQKTFWIAPTRRAIFGGFILLGLAVTLVLALVRLTAWLRHQQRLRRLTPRERAVGELERLLARQLPQKGLFKDFYIELTLVVRRYIERAHGIRAPGQTTEEFLAAARNHPRFPDRVLGSLRLFLESADLVKFAGQESNPQIAEQAVGTARAYIDQDAAEQQRTESSAKGGARP